MYEIIKIYPPLIGIVVDIIKVPDPVFSQKMVGDGVAIEPLDNKVYAPIDGIIKSVHNAKHALTISSKFGFDVLIHLGLDSVNLKGKGFDINVKPGDKITSGQILGEIDLDYIATHAKSLISPILLVDLDINKFTFSVTLNKLTNLTTPLIVINQKNINKTDALIKTSVKPEMIQSESIIIKNSQGIHARPAAILSAIAREYESEVLIFKNGALANLKSIVSVLGLAIEYKDVIQFKAESIEIIDRLNKAVSQFTDNIKDHNDEAEFNNTPQILGNKYFGISASIGIVSGQLTIGNNLSFEIQENSVEDISTERDYFYNALNRVKKDIKYNISSLKSGNDLDKDILSTHLLILTDPDLIKEVTELIEEHKTVSFAIQTVIEKHCINLASSGNQLLIERQNDLKDIKNRLLNSINNSTINSEHIKSNIPAVESIMVVDELTPGDLINLDANIIGLVSVKGGTTSHVAIMAKARGIPLLVGVDSSILNIQGNIKVILNTKQGFLNLAPTEIDLIQVKKEVVQLKAYRELNLQAAALSAITSDGAIISCMGNITNEAEANELETNGADGVGLFRTEFIFFNKTTAPSIDEQNKIYTSIANILNDKIFIIRTLDAGGEKQVDYLKFPHEENPALGIRGIRLCLEQKELLIDQLTAILQIAKPNIKILLPMVSTIEEFREVKQLFIDIKKKLAITIDIQLGVMVEVPSVALMSNIFAKEVDFFSIGTNDLSQYTLAIDRAHPKLAIQVDHLHPAILRNIELVVKGADKYNRPVSVCGFMASEKLAIPVLLGLGIRELSMNINTIAENKALIRKLNLSECKTIASACLDLDSATSVRDYLAKALKHVLN